MVDIKRSTYFATTSHSTLTSRPGLVSPRFVRSSVSGISETSSQSSPSAGNGEADAVKRHRAALDHVAHQAGPEARREAGARSRPR